MKEYQPSHKTHYKNSEKMISAKKKNVRCTFKCSKILTYSIKYTFFIYAYQAKFHAEFFYTQVWPSIHQNMKTSGVYQLFNSLCKFQQLLQVLVLPFHLKLCPRNKSDSKKHSLSLPLNQFFYFLSKTFLGIIYFLLLNLQNFVIR